MIHLWWGWVAVALYALINSAAIYAVFLCARRPDDERLIEVLFDPSASDDAREMARSNWFDSLY